MISPPKPRKRCAPPTGEIAQTKKCSSAIQRMARRGADIANVDPNVAGDADPHGDLDWYMSHFGTLGRWAIHAARYAIFDFHHACSRWLRRRRPSEEGASALAIMLGENGMTERLLMCSRKVRLEATRILLDVLTACWKESRNPERRWFFITFIGDEGHTLEYRPELAVKPFRRKVDRMIREENLNAFVVIEPQTLTNFPQQGHGGTIMVNAHAITWTDNRDFDPDVTAKRLCASSRLTHWLDQDTVEIKPMGDSAQDIRWLGYYLLKAPIVGKYLVRSDVPGKDWEFKDTRLRPDQAARLAEGLSQLELSDVAFGVNGGTEISRAWMRRVKNWHGRQLRRPRNRRSILARDVDVATLWSALRSSKRVTREPFAFRTTAERKPLAWSVTAMRAMERRDS